MGLSYVIAVVRADALEAVEQKLIGIGVRGLTVVKVKGLGRHANFFSAIGSAKRRNWKSSPTKIESTPSPAPSWKLPIPETRATAS